MTGNSIPVRQNETETVKLLAAAHGFYGRARQWSRWQLWLTAIVPAVFAFTGLQSRRWLELGAMYAVLIVIIDELLERMVDRYRTRAAVAQQMFDCTLYGWTLRTGQRRLDASDVEIWATHGSKKGLPLNWYPDNIAGAPLALARIVCQRANMWWDAQLRAGYVLLMSAGVIGLACVAIAAAWQFGWTIGITALAMVNVLPVIQWLVRNAIRHASTQSSTREQSERAVAIQDGLVSGRLSNETAEEESRALQEDIYERRRTSPLGVAWIYRKKQAEFDRGMKVNAAQVINEYFATHPKAK